MRLGLREEGVFEEHFRAELGVYPRDLGCVLDAEVLERRDELRALQPARELDHLLLVLGQPRTPLLARRGLLFRREIPARLGREQKQAVEQ